MVYNLAKVSSSPQQLAWPAQGELARRYTRGEGWGQDTTAGGVQAIATGGSLKLEEVSAKETRNLLQRFKEGKIINISSGKRSKTRQITGAAN